jgi:hypothetical protein
MKTYLIRLFVAFAWLAAFGQGAIAAVTFTVTPSAVSNTYNGTITLQIGGLTNKTVVVQKYLDLNTNGVIDGSDCLVQQFTLKDGTNFVIGGVTNFNVPGDLNATTGAITATLNFQNGDFMQNVVGNYLYVLSQTKGGFTPITNSFSVTNFPFPQRFTGNVVSNSTSTTLSNAIVLLFPGQAGNSSPLAGVVANNAGSYTVQVPPGTYSLLSFRSNFVANMNTAPLLMLSANQTITNNPTLTNATSSISGSVVDANNSSIGLPGVLVPAMSTDGLIAVTFTDTNGNFNVPVTAGTWEIQANDTSLLVLGYVGLNNGTNVTAGATGVTLAVPEATALIYGSVTDNLGNPMAGIDVEAYDTGSNLYGPDGYTDTNGNYFLGIVGGLNDDPWQIQISSDKSPANYIFSQPDLDSNGGTNINSGQAVLANFTAILAINQITGTVKDSNNNPIAGVGVNANATINSVNFSQYVDTDANGNYSMNVANGSWDMHVSCDGDDGVQNLGYQCPNDQTITIANNNGLANFTVQTNINVGGTLQVTTAALPNGTVGAAYDQQLTADGGYSGSSYSWSVYSGSLPAGLSMDSGGTIQGTPTASGTNYFTVQVSDNNDNTATQALSLTINSAVLQVMTTSLSGGTTNVPYNSQQLTASGGQPPYSWSLASGMLPPGLSLSTNGVISGTPTVAGTSNFVVRVTDSAMGTATQALSLVVYKFSTSVTFAVTPPAVSNLYTGTIILQAGGLAGGETVVVQKYLDLNTNGIIDGNDWLVQQFDLTDGQAGMVIGGIVNSNVPGDTDTTAGQITAKLNFHNGDFMQNIAGKYLYKLFSPVGHFAPITNQFTVTNLPFLQMFTGNVVSNGTSTTVPNAVVILFSRLESGGKGVNYPQAGAVANNLGNYTIPVPAGNYIPMAFKSNYLVNFAAAPFLSLSSGQTLTTNLTVTNATSSISGRMVDAANSSIGLPGIFLSMQSTNGMIGVGFSDTNGNFTVGVRSGQWSFKSDETGLILHGYVGLINGTNLNAGSTAVTNAVPKATALIYGSVKDTFRNPMVGIDVYLGDGDAMNLYETDAYTDPNGNYVAGVVGGLGTNQVWFPEISTDNNNGNPTNYLFTQSQINGNINSDTAVLQNFTGMLATNHIFGSVTINSTAIVGVGVQANQNISGANFWTWTHTDTNGNYVLNVGNGTWDVSVYCSASGYGDDLDSILGAGNYVCPNDQFPTINNSNATNNFVVQGCNGIQILTTNFPAGEVNVYYDQFLLASSCNGPITGSVISGTPPPGLTGNPSSGEIYGTPTIAGTFTFTIQLSDGVNTTNKQFSIGISNAVQVTTTSLPDGTNGASYSQQLQASDGLTPYTWSLSPGSADLPSNLGLAPNGVISGTPATNGTFYFYVRVTDSASVTADQLLSLTISKISLQVTTTTLSNATQNAAYSATLAATGGQPPYYWSRAPGSAKLPYYLDLDTNGVISGTPVSSGTNRFIVRVTDSASATADQLLKLVVSASTNQQVIVLSEPTQLANGQFQFTFNTASGVSYIIQYSTNLTDWTSVSILSGSGGPLTVSDLTATDKQRFYRVKVEP